MMVNDDSDTGLGPIEDRTIKQLETFLHVLIHLNRYGQLSDDIRKVQAELDKRTNSTKG